MCSLIAPQLWRRQLPEGPSVFPASRYQLLTSMKWEPLTSWVWKPLFSTARYTNELLTSVFPRWGGWSPEGEEVSVRWWRCQQDREYFYFSLVAHMFFCPTRFGFPSQPSPTQMISGCLALLRSGMFVHWQAEDGRPQKSWIFNQQLLLWEMRGWSHPPSGRDPGGRWVLQRVPVASCWHRGSR